MKFYYQQSSEQLEMYQRLIQYWSMIFDRKMSVHVLDNMNFNLALFPQPLNPSEVAQLHPIEPGYTSPDASTELHLFVRELEYARLCEKNLPHRYLALRQLVDSAGVGFGNGCSNVMNAVINSIVKLTKARNLQKPEVLSTLPNYTVYAAQLSNLINVIDPKFILTKREHNFLPTFSEFREMVTENTIAFILTYPTNPAQSTYEGDMVSDLSAIVHFCQENKIFLIVDNIYQDLIFSNHQFTEVFSLTDSLDYVVKIYGSSKDTPFFSGYRTGYWFGDPQIENIYRYYISLSENSLNTYSMVLFALNMYFKTLNILKSEPASENLYAFQNGVFGWSQNVSRKQLLQKMLQLDLFGKYRQRIAESNRIQAEALQKVIAFVEQSKCFCDYVNQLTGNVFFVKVNPEYFKGDDDDFFRFLFYEARYGVLPGNVFGMPCIPNEAWFRITLIHDTIDNIIRHLQNIEDYLILNRKINPLKIWS